MKKITQIILISVLMFSTIAYAQDEEKKDRPWRLEIEPTSFASPGWSLLGSYGVTKDRNLSVGLYTLGAKIPNFLKGPMFYDVAADDPLRMTFELALTVRYKIPVFKEYESNPYIGMFYGWQSYTHQDLSNANAETKFNNMFLTPQVGFEIYVFRQMLYLNPSFRVVYEFAKKSDYNNPLDATELGPRIKDWIWWPSFAVGLRF